MLSALFGCNPSPSAPPPGTPAAVDAAAAARPAGGRWVDVPAWAIAPKQAVSSYVPLGGGRFAAVISSGGTLEDHVVLRGGAGAPSKSIPPWSCVASPAELQASGADLWVHCIDPQSDKPRVHFWHSADSGDTWTRVGAADGPLAVGNTFAGGTFFATGTFEGTPALLHVVARDHGRWTAVRSHRGDWPSDTNTTIAASEDGATVALLGVRPGEMRVSASIDGGKTLVSLWSAPSRQRDLPWLSPSVTDRTLWIPMELDDGKFGSLLSLPLTANKPTASIHRFKRPAEKACAFGPRVVVRWTASEWGLSRDAGDSFAPIPAAGDGAPEEELKCSRYGAQYGARFLAWE